MSVHRVDTPHGTVTFDKLYEQVYAARLNDEPIGTVRYREQRYNLRRVYVSRWWEAERLDRTPVQTDRGSTSFRTRTDAARALAEAVVAESGTNPDSVDETPTSV